MGDTREAVQFELEQTLFQEQRVWFYHVPATHVSTLAPRADAWDPEHPFLTGSIHVIQKGDACWIRMYEPPKDGQDNVATEGNQRTLFAQSPVEITKELTLELYVQDCADSSRYFMIRVEDEATKRRAYLGIGFPERASAFNFKAALQDYVKYVHRQMEVAALAAQAENGNATEDSAPSPRTQDLSIPKGAMIRINLKMNSATGDNPERRRRTSSEGQQQQQDGIVSPPKVPLIPPPPADPLAFASPSNKTALTMKASAVDEDEDWGDFTSA